MTIDMTYKAIEILTNIQPDDFADFLLGGKSNTPEEPDEDEVMQEKIEV